MMQNTHRNVKFNPPQKTRGPLCVEHTRQDLNKIPSETYMDLSAVQIFQAEKNMAETTTKVTFVLRPETVFLSIRVTTRPL